MAFHTNLSLFRGGFIGVDIFFVLSGFLITSLLVREYDKFYSINLKNFYIRRILRLIPALSILLIALCIISYVLLNKNSAERNYIDSLIALFYLSNWARAFSIHPPYFLGHTWSLSIEEQFYVIWPIFVLFSLRFIKRRNILKIIFLLALSSWLCNFYFYFTGAPPERLYNGLDTRCYALLIGSFLGFITLPELRRCIEFIPKKLFMMITLFASISLVFILLFSHWKAKNMFLYGYLFVSLLTALMIINVLIYQDSYVCKFLSTRWLTWIGSISYGLYLWHYPIFLVIKGFGFEKIQIALLGVPLTFAVASVSYYIIERPILSLKKRF